VITIEMLPGRIAGVTIADVQRWIALSWVRPDGTAGHWVFHEIDVARVRLILELRDELNVNEEALPTVLSLMDQLYDARRQMRMLRAALDAAPEELRRSLRPGRPEGT
jgi:chaperone modulatory protein CbpM